MGPPGAEGDKWGRGLDVEGGGRAARGRAAASHRGLPWGEASAPRGVWRAERAQPGTAWWILAQSIAGSRKNPRWLEHGSGAGRSLVTPVPLPWTLRAGIARRALPARFPPLTSGRGVGGARGRHECATAASSHSRTHPSRLLAVAVATSRRWGIYRGELRSVGRTGLGGCLPGQPPASLVPWVGAQAVLLAGCRPSCSSHLGAVRDLRVEIKNKYPCCSPLLRAPGQASLVLAGLCRAGLLLCGINCLLFLTLGGALAQMFGEKKKVKDDETDHYCTFMPAVSGSTNVKCVSWSLGSRQV